MKIELGNVLPSIYDGVCKRLEDKVYRSEMYSLGGWDVSEEVVVEYVNELLSNEKVQANLVREISKRILAKHKKNQREQKLFKKRNEQLWKVTNGEIPCLCGCGNVMRRTKEEVLRGSNNFILEECHNRLGDEIFKAFGNKTVYDMFDIK